MLEFKSSAGHKLEFEAKPLGQGGEGAVHKQFDHLGYGDIGDLAKIFAPTKRGGKEAKLKAMMETRSPRPSHSYAWPKELLYDIKTGEFCGYVMYLKQNKIELGDIYGYNSPFRTEGDDKMKEWRFFVALARNLARAVAGVHDIGQVIGDLNDKNILIDPETCEVTLIDTDSFHITRAEETYRCTVGKSEYVPKEVQNVKFASAELPTFTRHTDNFSLAILIFKLLMNGVHPFNSVGIDEKSIEDNIGDGRSPFFANYAKLNTAFYAPNADIFPPVLKKLFEVAFVGSANNPEKRPSAIEFFDELVKLEKSENLYSCTTKPWHIFPSTTNECPWCAIERRQEERLTQIAALSVLTSNVTPDYSVARYNPVQNYKNAQAEQAAAAATAAAAAAALAATQAAATTPSVAEPEKPIKPEIPEEPVAPVMSEVPEVIETPEVEQVPEVAEIIETPEISATPDAFAAFESFETGETFEEFTEDFEEHEVPEDDVVTVSMSAASVQPVFGTKRNKNKIFAIAGAAAAAVLLVVGIIIAATLSNNGEIKKPPNTTPSSRTQGTTPGNSYTDLSNPITTPTTVNDDLFTTTIPTTPSTIATTTGEPTNTAATTTIGGGTTRTSPPTVATTRTSPPTPGTPSTPVPTPPTTTQVTTRTTPPTTTVTTRTTPTTTVTTRTTPTTTRTTATSRALEQRQVIFNMQNQTNLGLFAGQGSAGNSTHPTLKSNSGTRTVNQSTTPSTILITSRSGESQGVDINLASFNFVQGRSYEFTFAGSVTSGSGSHVIKILAISDIVSERDARGNDFRTLTDRNFVTSASFSLSATLTQAQIAELVENNVSRIRLGGAARQDLTISGVTVTEIR